MNEKTCFNCGKKCEFVNEVIDSRVYCMDCATIIKFGDPNIIKDGKIIWKKEDRMICPYCKNILILQISGLWKCPKCSLMINTLNMEEEDKKRFENQ